MILYTDSYRASGRECVRETRSHHGCCLHRVANMDAISKTSVHLSLLFFDFFYSSLVCYISTTVSLPSPLPSISTMLPLRKQQASQRHQPNILKNPTIRSGIYHHIKPGQGKTIRGKVSHSRQKSQAKSQLPLLRFPQEHQIMQT